MKVRVLGCSGAIARGRRTTSFLVDDRLLVDAGTGVGDLTLDEMAAIDHVVLSHCHLDHVAALPMMVDAVAARRSTPLQVHALPQTVAALRAHIFNNLIWPDFSVIPTAERPFIQFRTFEIGQTVTLGRTSVEILPASHTVPAAGFAVSSAGGPAWVFTGDTGPNPAFWQRLKTLDVAALVIETAFSDAEAALAEISKHLAPATLGAELRQIERAGKFPVWITHTKPAETELIMAEIASLPRGAQGIDAALEIRWLKEGHVLEV
ncbi:MBL fold metallo-hydrolase [Xylophilus rhododendri]|uniref:MBL fold metallo-hydrolase n=1 Tax=Xylophilus rhododendri TaxID=2697032 RepID=A0A857J7F9_9BURK|nr:3',5'-cyclic-nucleotide phosphodiesterase [Xylophilus rhododendri]QHI98991.1 MBL fold metallo-hydrolase [Xylophilus rhododendri]